MDGIAVGLDENFLDEGDTQEVEWREQDIEMKQNYGDVKGPPLHPNCRCVLIGELTPQAEKMLVEKGGSGSGNFGHEGRPGEVGGSGGGGGRDVHESKADIARRSMNVAKTAEQRFAENVVEPRVATALKGVHLPDNEPFDVVGQGVGIEVKAIISGKNDKITMKKDAINRKYREARKMGIGKRNVFTVVVDSRGADREDPSTWGVYVRRGCGAFRLGAMEKIGGMSELSAWVDSHKR